MPQASPQEAGPGSHVLACPNVRNRSQVDFRTDLSWDRLISWTADIAAQ
jgi:hypothetical protein